MRILSFDVGIKNLAVCLLECNDNKIIIDTWDVINIIEDTKIDELKCLYNNCDKKVKSYIDFNSNKYYFCTKHLSNKNELVFNNFSKNNWNEINNNICSKCLDNKTKKKLFNNNILNETFCSKHYNSLMKNIGISSNKIYNINSIKTKDLSIDFIKESLINVLDSHLDKFCKVDYVYIENQPTLKNPSMKAISDTIYTWFLIRCIIDKNLNNSSIQKIKFISPSNKLKEFDKKSIEEADDKNKYKETKKLSIDITKKLLKYYNLDDWNIFFMSHKKQDDLADCFLQGIYILNKEYNFIKNISFEENIPKL